jgi:hypothetical protein
MRGGVLASARQTPVKERLMSKAAKTIATGRAPVPSFTDQSDDSDVLHFLTRTLQAHFLDAEPQHMLEKLRNLRSALDQQEITLSDWPESPSKDRICAALAKAKNLVAQILDEYGAVAEMHSGAGDFKAV